VWWFDDVWSFPEKTVGWAVRLSDSVSYSISYVLDFLSFQIQMMICLNWLLFPPLFFQTTYFLQAHRVDRTSFTFSSTHTKSFVFNCLLLPSAIYTYGLNSLTPSLAQNCHTLEFVNLKGNLITSDVINCIKQAFKRLKVHWWNRVNQICHIIKYTQVINTFIKLSIIITFNNVMKGCVASYYIFVSIDRIICHTRISLLLNFIDQLLRNVVIFNQNIV